VGVNFTANPMQLDSNSHTQSQLVVTRITAKAIMRRVQSMVIDFLRGQENCAVWPARKRPNSAALRPASLTEQFIEFNVARR
jgi:glucose-6-phosphate dehydrogenase assembly protein OpcA